MNGRCYLSFLLLATRPFSVCILHSAADSRLVPRLADGRTFRTWPNKKRFRTRERSVSEWTSPSGPSGFPVSTESVESPLAYHAVRSERIKAGRGFQQVPVENGNCKSSTPSRCDGGLSSHSNRNWKVFCLAFDTLVLSEHWIEL